MKRAVHNYTVIFQKEPEGGYTVFAPLLPGCVTYGKDLEEAKKMIQEAIELYIESLEMESEEVPIEEYNTFLSQISVDFNQLKLPRISRSTYA